MLRRETDK